MTVCIIMKFKVQILHTLTKTASISPDFQNLAWGHLCSIVAIFEITVKLPLGDFKKSAFVAVLVGARSTCTEH